MRAQKTSGFVEVRGRRVDPAGCVGLGVELLPVKNAVWLKLRRWSMTTPSIPPVSHAGGLGDARDRHMPLAT